VGLIAELLPAQIASLKKGRLFYLMHLPSHNPQLQESYVDFTRMYSFDRKVDLSSTSKCGDNFCSRIDPPPREQEPVRFEDSPPSIRIDILLI